MYLVLSSIFPVPKKMNLKLNLDLNLQQFVCYLPHKYASCRLTFVSIHLTCSRLTHWFRFIHSKLRKPTKHFSSFSPFTPTLRLFSLCLSLLLSFFLYPSRSFLFNGTFDESLLIGHCLDKVSFRCDLFYSEIFILGLLQLCED